MRPSPSLRAGLPAAIVTLGLLAGCAAGPQGPDAVNDPYEPLNRQVHAFNQGLDAAVVRPLAKPLKAAAGEQPGEPGPLTVLGNVGGNLSLPGKVINHLLQGRPDAAAQNAARFVVNTTLGLAGIHDPAGAEFGLTEIDTDFGETLHRWGVPEGAYLELPVLGPSTERDFAGKVVDWALDPVGQWLNDDTRRAARAVRLISKAGERARFGDTVDSVLHESADSYAQTRLIYLQHRRHSLGQETEIIDPYAQ